MSAQAFFEALQVSGDTFSDLLAADPELISATNDDGNTPLHIVAATGNLAHMVALAPFKPSLTALNKHGQTPLTLAVAKTQYGAVRKLVELGAPIDAAHEGTGAIHVACQIGDVEGIRLLRTLGANPQLGAPVVHCAVESLSLFSVASAVYDLAGDINALNADSETPLFAALRSKKSDIVQFLLEHGAQPNAISATQNTALHIAAEFGSAEDIRSLVGFGASKDAKNKDGKTALDVAKDANSQGNVRELSRTKAPEPKEAAMRFKDHGNKVFGSGENMKAARFYTQAIQIDPSNHVFFSNRAACYFNQGQFKAAYYDACRCIALDPQWPKGYFRKAATEQALKDFAAAKATVAKGLAAVPGNADLVKLQNELAKSK